MEDSFVSHSHPILSFLCSGCTLITGKFARGANRSCCCYCCLIQRKKAEKPSFRINRNTETHWNDRKATAKNWNGFWNVRKSSTKFLFTSDFFVESNTKRNRKWISPVAMHLVLEGWRRMNLVNPHQIATFFHLFWQSYDSLLFSLIRALDRNALLTIAQCVLFILYLGALFLVLSIFVYPISFALSLFQLLYVMTLKLLCTHHLQYFFEFTYLLFGQCDFTIQKLILFFDQFVLFL